MVKVTNSSFRPSPPTSLSLGRGFPLQRVTIAILGRCLYGYYDVICNPLVHTSPFPVSLVDLMA